MAHNVGQLSKRYTRMQDYATIIIFALMTLMFATMHKFEKVEIKQVEKAEEIKVKDVEVTVQVKKSVQPSRALIPVGVDEDDAEEMENLVETQLDIETDFDMTDEMPLPPEPPSQEEQEDEIVEFFAVQQKPEFVGGSNVVYKNLVYPKMAKMAGVGGVVYVQFVAGTNGLIRDINVIKEDPAGYGFKEAVINALKKVRVTPGMQRDKKVPVRMQMPIKFQTK